MKIILTTDHAGFEQIQKIKAFLTKQGHECLDFGPKELNQDDDYPDLIYPAARALANGEADMGIIMGGSGQGEAIVANRVKGVRCAVYYGAAEAQEAIDADGSSSADKYDIVRLSRHHNNANMLSIGARFVSDEEIEKVVTMWLATPFETVERHQRRITKIDALG